VPLTPLPDATLQTSKNPVCVPVATAGGATARATIRAARETTSLESGRRRR
jgi:hypothetical protein